MAGIIPAVRTDHDAISLELGKLEKELKERRKKELDLQEELFISKAKCNLENNPNDHNTTYYNVVQGKLESFLSINILKEKKKGVNQYKECNGL